MWLAITRLSGALAQVNYYELCNILEARYGLREAHNIDRFDAYFSRRGLRGEFLSGFCAYVVSEDVRRINDLRSQKTGRERRRHLT